MVGPVSELLANTGYFVYSHRASRCYEREAPGFGISWRNRTHHAAFSQFVCSDQCPSPPLLNKLLLITDTIVPSTASDGKTVPASPPFCLELQQGEQTL